MTVALQSPPLFSTSYFTPPTHSNTSMLYPELIDQVIDHCHADPRTLRTCSLVNKTWLPSARFHLFSHIRLLESNYQTFIQLLTSSTSSTLPLYIQSIEVFHDHSQGPNSEWLSKIIPFLTHFPKISISAVEISIADARLSGRSREALEVGPGFRDLAELKLVDVHFNRFEEVRELICSFPVLRKLSLDGVWNEFDAERDSDPLGSWGAQAGAQHHHHQHQHVHPQHHNHFGRHDKPPATRLTSSQEPIGLGLPPSNLPRPAKTLREVELATCRTHDVLGWFLMLDPVPVFPILRLGHIIIDELPIVKEYLRVSAEALEHLTLQPEREVQERFTEVDLSNATSLQSLTLDGVFCSLDTTIFSSILSQVPFRSSPSSGSGSGLRRVTLASCMGTRPPNHAADWTSVDTALTRHINLERVVVTSKLVGTADEPKLEKMEKRAPGIVEVCTHKRPLFC